MSSSTLPKTIILGGEFLSFGEGVAAVAIMPGMLLSGVSGPRVIGKPAHQLIPAPAGYFGRTFAREADIIGRDLNDGYAVGENVLTLRGLPGNWLYAWLAPGQNVAEEATLSAAGAGALGAAIPGSQGAAEPFAVVFPSPVVARALEAVNNSAGAAPVRIMVELL